MSEWIDVNETVKQSGKSLATVRRAIKRLDPESVKSDKGKHLYKRMVILRELGIDPTLDIVSTQAASASVMTNSLIEHDTVNESPLIESLKDQIRMQSEQLKEKQSIIEQLLERQRETNILLNQLRLLTTKEPATLPGKTSNEIRRENIILIVAFIFLAVLFGLVIWFSWR